MKYGFINGIAKSKKVQILENAQKKITYFFPLDTFFGLKYVFAIVSYKNLEYFLWDIMFPYSTKCFPKAQNMVKYD